MRVVLFFSRGMSLDGWRSAGILERELALYRLLRPELEHLAFVTYGGTRDLALAPELPAVEILVNRWSLPSNIYSVLAPVLHARVLRRATVFKTNQLNGAWCGLIAKWLFGKKLVVRCGFLWADFVARLHPARWYHVTAVYLERRVLQLADAVIVAGEADRDTVIARYGLSESRVHAITNYVDTTIFRPLPDVAPESGRVTFVGRLDEQKNPMAMLEAARGLTGIHLVVVGDGPLRSELQAMAERSGLHADFLGIRPHGELPALLNRSTVFVLPSHFEGNPKSLIEAMACGVPVVGTRVPGIREIVEHGKTGWLCGTSQEEIRAALAGVLGDAKLRGRIGAAGLAYVREHHSLSAAAERELSLLQSL